VSAFIHSDEVVNDNETTTSEENKPTHGQWEQEKQLNYKSIIIYTGRSLSKSNIGN
jgi:hypothetical protein